MIQLYIQVSDQGVALTEKGQENCQTMTSRCSPSQNNIKRQGGGAIISGISGELIVFWALELDESGQKRLTHVTI